MPVQVLGNDIAGADTPRSGSAVEAVRRSYERIAAWDDPALFISLKDRLAVLDEAGRIDAGLATPLRGLVFAVKDNIDVAGMETTAACPAFAYRADRSAFAVARLEAAGAIVIGKTNLDQFATGLVGVRSPYGIPRNALRADLIPGGSSSGSATAVAAGIVDFALGTDTAGSGRIPAGMNGIVGLKPSLGLISGTGMVPACRTLDTISVFSREVATGFEALSVAAGFDAADPWSKPMALGPAGKPPVLKVGISRKDQRKFFGDPHSEAAVEADLDRLATLGATLVEIDFGPLLETARLLYEGPWVAERYAATKPLIEQHPEAFHPTTLKIISGAKDLTAVGAFEAIYKLQALRRKAAAIFAEIDVLAVPTVPRFYTVAEVLADPVALNSNLGTYTNFVNLLDLAAIAVPVGTRGDSLPSGLTLIGRSGTDGLLAGIGLALEGHEVTTPVGGIEIAVVGAHLSGLPLNHELVALGGRFVRKVTTTPSYRLYALPGTTPPKPGLMRTAEGQGAGIEAEVWSLDAAAFGTFVARIPKPLGIGTLDFADGSSAKGFLVEAEAVKGAEDISSYGGWRAYLTR